MILPRGRPRGLELASHFETGKGSQFLPVDLPPFGAVLDTIYRLGNLLLMNSLAMAAFTFGHLLVAIQTSPRIHLEARKEEKEEAFFFQTTKEKKKKNTQRY